MIFSSSPVVSAAFVSSAFVSSAAACVAAVVAGASLLPEHAVNAAAATNAAENT